MITLTATERMQLAVKLSELYNLELTVAIVLVKNFHPIAEPLVVKLLIERGHDREEAVTWYRKERKRKIKSSQVNWEFERVIARRQAAVKIKHLLG